MLVVKYDKTPIECTIDDAGFENLTALRGFAALGVLIFHCDLFLKPIVDQTLTMMIGNGWLLVDFFFILSGFILSHAYKDIFKGTITRSDYIWFVSRRFARIFPLHCVVLLLTYIIVLAMIDSAAGLSHFMQQMLDLGTFPAVLLLLNSLNLHATPPLNTSTWSLSAEWCTYLLFPLLAHLTWKFVNLPIVKSVLLFVFIFIMTYVFLYIGGYDFESLGRIEIKMTSNWGFIRCLIWFTIGLVTRFYASTFLDYDFIRRDIFLSILFIAVLSAMHFDINSVFTILLFPLLIFSASQNRGVVSKLLGLRAFQALGKLSFAIYLVHVPLIYIYWLIILQKHPDALLRVGVIQSAIEISAWILCIQIIVVTVLLSWFLHHTIEHPCNSFIRNLSGNGRRSSLS